MSLDSTGQNSTMDLKAFNFNFIYLYSICYNQNWCSWSPIFFWFCFVLFFSKEEYHFIWLCPLLVYCKMNRNRYEPKLNAYTCSGKQMWTPRWKIPHQWESRNGRWKNSRQQKQRSATLLTSPSLICCSVFRPQSKQMTWAAWGTGVPNSHLVSLKEEMWWIFIWGNCLKC